MLLPFFLAAAALTGADPADHAAAGKAKLLVLELEPVSVDKAVSRSVDPIVLNAAGAVDGVEVMAQSEIKTIASVEAEKAQMGCDTSCLAELAGAMGARFVLFGSVSKLGNNTTVALSLYDAVNTSVVRDSITVADVGALPAQLPDRVRALVTKARGPAVNATAAAAATTTPASPPPTGAPDEMSALGWAGVFGVVLGGTALLGGGVLATLNEVAIQDPRGDGVAKRAEQETGGVGLLVATIGAVVTGAGAVALVMQ